MKRFCLHLAVFALLLAGLAFAPHHAHGQVVTVPSVPVVNYVPERYGLLGLRTAYRPVISYAPAVSVAPTVVTQMPAVTSYYAPTTSYYAPTTSYYAPTTTYYAPAIEAPAATGVTTFYTPVAPAPVPTAVYYSPPVNIAPPVSTYRPVIIWP